MAFGFLNGHTRKHRSFGLPATGKPSGPNNEFTSFAGTPRPSDGIRSFFDHLSDRKRLQILDLGAVSQGTVAELGRQGHCIHCVGLLRDFEEALSSKKGMNQGTQLTNANLFIRTRLDYPRNSFHAVLAWDVLQHLDEVTRRVTVAYLSQIMRPNSVMFCIFHCDENETTAPVLHCSVSSEKSLMVREVRRRRRRRHTSIRKLETLFPQFRRVHLYLKRDSQFEVLVFG